MLTKNYSPSAIDLGINIRKWRLLKGHKQDQLARELGIKRVALSNIENGKTDITFSRLCGIAKVLEFDVKVLFG